MQGTRNFGESGVFVKWKVCKELGTLEKVESLRSGKLRVGL